MFVASINIYMYVDYRHSNKDSITKMRGVKKRGDKREAMTTTVTWTKGRRRADKKTREQKKRRHVGKRREERG